MRPRDVEEILGGPPRNYAGEKGMDGVGVCLGGLSQVGIPKEWVGDGLVVVVWFDMPDDVSAGSDGPRVLRTDYACFTPSWRSLLHRIRPLLPL
jgi:hypothetical protein